MKFDTPSTFPTSAPKRKRESYSLMLGLSAGHGVKHFGQGALLVMSPFIRATLGLSEVAFGGIFTAQSIAAGVANIPAGILTDMYRKKVALVLAISMMMVGTGYLLVGISPWYWLLILAVMFVGFGTSLWHAPAFGTLSARYPERRGLAIAAHLTGAQIGNTTSPIIIGFLLGGTIGAWHFEGILWRWIAGGLLLPMALTALMVMLRFKTAGIEVERNLDFGEYLTSVRRLLGNFRVLGLVTLGAFRGAVHNSFQVFVVLYMYETLQLSAFSVGLHVSLLTLAGIVSTPIMGWFSDKVGRKIVIVVAMSIMTGLLFLFLFFNSGVPLTVLIAVLGLFFFSVMPIITAAAMDQIDRGSEGSATALIFAGGSILGALSPLAAGAIYTVYNFQGVVIYSGTIAAIGVIIAIFLPMQRSRG